MNDCTCLFAAICLVERQYGEPIKLRYFLDIKELNKRGVANAVRGPNSSDHWFFFSIPEWDLWFRLVVLEFTHFLKILTSHPWIVRIDLTRHVNIQRRDLPVDGTVIHEDCIFCQIFVSLYFSVCGLLILLLFNMWIFSVIIYKVINHFNHSGIYFFLVNIIRPSWSKVAGVVIWLGKRFHLHNFTIYDIVTGRHTFIPWERWRSTGALRE